jgi:FkbH-like protein
MRYAKAVRDCPLFERLTASAEDRERGGYYREQRERRELASGEASLEDFYYSLAQTVEIAPATRETVARVAQLLQKTNQFNLTTRRHSATDVAGYVEDPAWDVYAAQVRDRFGDNGIVGVCITRRSGEVCEIDTLLLSCRVIGRTVEDAILHFLAERNRARGIRRIEGWFLPTRKNKPAESFYPRHGFLAVSQSETGTLWALDLEEKAIACPPWIQLSAAGEMECAHA